MSICGAIFITTMLLVSLVLLVSFLCTMDQRKFQPFAYLSTNYSTGLISQTHPVVSLVEREAEGHISIVPSYNCTTVQGKETKCSRLQCYYSSLLKNVMYRVNRGIEKAVNYLSLFSASRITVGRHRLLLKIQDQMGQILSYLGLKSVPKTFLNPPKTLLSI